MQGSKSCQPRIFYQVSLEQLVPDDHLVRRLAKVLDLRWVRQTSSDCYSHTGRPSIDPLVIAKMFVLGFLYNIVSERQLMRDIRVNLAYRWYLDYDLDEAIPDHSVLSKARRRLGTKFFEQIFTYVLQGCRQAGLVNGENLLIDSTAMAANASAESITALRYTPQQYWQQLEKTSEDSNEDVNAPSPLQGLRRHGGNLKFLGLLIEKIPFFVLAGVSSVITFLVQRSGGAMPDIFPLKIKFANAVISYIRYIGKLFVPQNLAVIYPFDVSTVWSWQVAMCVLLLLVISILVIVFGRSRKYLPVGWFWFVGTLVPVIGFVQVGLQSMADRYSYIPYIGLFIIIAWGLPELLSKWRYRKIVLGIAAVMVLTAMGITAFLQAGYWKNSSALFTHAIEVTQDNYLAYNNLGEAYLNLDRYQDAIEAYNQAVKINPDSADAYCGFGASYIKLGRYQDAIESYKQAIKIKPDYAEAYNNLAVAYFNIGSFQDVLESCRQAINIKPDYADAHYNLGVTYLITADLDAAFQEYEILKTLDTKKADQLFNLINK